MLNCGNRDDFEVITIPELRGEKGQTRVTFLNMPVRYSSSRNQKRLVEGDFGAMLMDEIFYRQNFYAKRKGFFRSSYCCFKCGAHLDDAQAQHSIFELKIKYGQFNPFVVKVETLAIRCPVCATINAIDPDEHHNEAIEAIMNAFASQNIQP